MAYRDGTDLILGFVIDDTFLPFGHSTGCKISDSSETGERVTKEASSGKWKEKYIKSLAESILDDGLGHLDDGKLVISTGNSTTALTLTTVAALTVWANPGVPNFAMTIDNSGNSGDVTVIVKDNTGTTTLLKSSDAGNQIAAGAISQLTCVANCWTLADFEA